MRSHLVKGADRIELTIRSYTDRTGRTPKKKTLLQVHHYHEKDDKWKIGDLWLAIEDLQDDQREVARGLMVLKTEVDAMAAREAQRQKKEGNIS